MTEKAEKSWFSKYLDKSYWNAKNIITAIAFAVFVFQFLFIAYINIFECHSWVDHDASMTYSHAIELFKQHTYVLKEFNEETFLHIDTACLLAVPFYGITKDIFLAYGISNVIFVIISIFVISDLVGKISDEKMHKYVALILFLIPYRMGMLQYTTMVFFECSFYSFCVLVPLLLIDLFLYKNEEAKGVKYWLIFALYCVMTFITAFSRGTYAFLVALAPILLCYALEIILSKEGFKKATKSKNIAAIATIVSYALGMGLLNAMHITLGRTGYNLVNTKDIINNFFKVIWGHMSIFVDRSNPSVMSLDGIKWLIMLGMAVVIFIIIIFNLRHAFTEEEYSNELRYFTVVYVWNFCVLGLTQCAESDIAFPERYLFPGFVPVLISVPIALHYIAKTERVLLRNSFYIVLSAVTLCTVVVSDANMFKAFEKSADDLQGVYETIAVAKENDVDTIFFLNDDNAGLISRSLEPDMKIVSIDTRQDGSYSMCAREFYKSAHDRNFYGESNIIAVTWNEQLETLLPDYMISSYVSLGDVEDYHLYIAGSNKFDDMAGFPLDDNVLYETIDFPYSYGYVTLGEINAYGYLETTGNGDYVLVSPELKAPYTTCDVTLDYEMGLKTKEDGKDSSTGVVGSLFVLDAGLSPVYVEDIVAGNGSATITTDYMGPCYVAVRINQGVKITLQDIHFKVSE